VTDSMGCSAVGRTKCSASSAVTATGMRLADHMTANKQYFAKYKRFSALINTSLVNKGSIHVYRSGRVNIDMLVHSYD